MSDEQHTTPKRWPSIQAYSLAAICLLVGVAMGYLGRGGAAPKNRVAPASTASTQAPAMPGQVPPNHPPMEQMPGGAPGGASQGAMRQPAPEEMKRMAAKAVAPLLEQLKQNPNDAELQTKIGVDYVLPSLRTRCRTSRKPRSSNPRQTPIPGWLARKFTVASRMQQSTT